MPAIIAPPKPGINKEVRHRMIPESEEMIASCPKCKTFETLWFARNRLNKTRKFSQEGEQIYHDCGADKPCHLRRIF